MRSCVNLKALAGRGFLLQMYVPIWPAVAADRHFSQPAACRSERDVAGEMQRTADQHAGSRDARPPAEAPE